jgi:hypothetical protein
MTVLPPWRSRQPFQEEISKIHEFTQNFGVHICYTVRLYIFDRLAAAVILQMSHNLENRKSVF